MKILYLLNRVPWPLKDGGSIAMHSMLQGLSSLGVEITALSFNTNKHFVNNQTIENKLSSIATWHTIPVNTNVSLWGAVAALLQNQSYHAVRFYQSRFEQKLIDLLQQQTYDVVVCESVFMAQYIQTIKTYSNATTVLRQHNVEWKIWDTLAKQTNNWIKKQYISILAQQLKRFEIRYLQQFDKVVSITDADANEFIKMGVKVPIHTCPLGIRIAEKPNLPDGAAVFHLGSMEWQPNIEGVNWFLEEVWPLVIEKIEGANCYIAGRGMPESWKQRNIQGVNMIGEVQDANVFMQDKAIMIVPIFAGSGIRVKILEGMRAGKAIVSTTIGVQGIPCEPNKHLLLADDKNTFANHIVSLINDSVKRKQMALNGFEFVSENYDQNRITQKLIDYITQK
jgi:glycosyltransferase involved in cell wall biosynthesis